MESNIKVKATYEEINDAFENSQEYSIRYFKRAKRGLFDVLLRHKELPQNLDGTFTVKELNQLLADKTNQT